MTISNSIFSGAYELVVHNMIIQDGGMFYSKIQGLIVKQPIFMINFKYNNMFAYFFQ